MEDGKKIDNDVLISIIINGYNTRDYIRQCVSSTLDQNFKNYEIIIVDDGSTDDSAQIGDELADQYDIVRAYTKENGGLADARNFGLEKAYGEYILYVDGDDYIETDSLKKIWKRCIEQGKPDIVFLQASRLFEDGTEKKYDKNMDYEELSKGKEEALFYISKRDMYPAGAWRKLLRREFLINNGIHFKKGQSPEDYEWSIQTFLKADSFGCCNTKYYYYRQKRKGSISNTANEKSVATLFEIVDHWIEMARSGTYSGNTSECIERFASYVYRVALWYVFPYYDEFKDKVKEFRYLLKLRNSNDIKLIRLASKIISMNETVKLISCYAKMRDKIGR